MHVGLDEVTSNDRSDTLCSCDEASKSPLFLEYALRSGAGPEGRCMGLYGVWDVCVYGV